MIKFHLDRLLFENDKMKVSQLVEVTGLNKNTLYAMERNETKRVDVEALNTICKALNCKIEELVEYIPD
jgi:putative transcriptional regulator